MPPRCLPAPDRFARASAQESADYHGSSTVSMGAAAAAEARGNGADKSLAIAKGVDGDIAVRGDVKRVPAFCSVLALGSAQDESDHQLSEASDNDNGHELARAPEAAHVASIASAAGSAPLPRTSSSDSTERPWATKTWL